MKQTPVNGKLSMMQIVSEKEIVNLIKQQEPFSAVIKNGAFSIKIDRYIPAICTAVHSGTAFSDHLAGKVQLDEQVRRWEARREGFFEDRRRLRLGGRKARHVR